MHSLTPGEPTSTLQMATPHGHMVIMVANPKPCWVTTSTLVAIVTSYLLQQHLAIGINSPVYQKKTCENQSTPHYAAYKPTASSSTTHTPMTKHNQHNSWLGPLPSYYKTAKSATS